MTLELSEMFDTPSAYRRPVMGCNLEKEGGTIACRLPAVRTETIVGQPTVGVRCIRLKLYCLNSSPCDSCLDDNEEWLKSCLGICGSHPTPLPQTDNPDAPSARRLRGQTENLTAPYLSRAIITGSPKLVWSEDSRQYGDGVSIVPNVSAQQPKQSVINPIENGGIR